MQGKDEEVLFVHLKAFGAVFNGLGESVKNMVTVFELEDLRNPFPPNDTTNLILYSPSALACQHHS